MFGSRAHSQAMKKAASAPALPTCSGVKSGQARQITAAANAAAKASRPTSGVGGERSAQCSKRPASLPPDSGPRPIQLTSTASSASSASQRQPAPCRAPRSAEIIASSALSGTSTVSTV